MPVVREVLVMSGIFQHIHSESAADWDGRNGCSCCGDIGCKTDRQAGSVMGLLSADPELFNLHGIAPELFLKRGSMHSETLSKIDERRCAGGQKRRGQERSDTKATHDGLQS